MQDAKMTTTIEVDKKILYNYLKKTLHILNAFESSYGRLTKVKVHDPELRNVYAQLHKEFRE